MLVPFSDRLRRVRPCAGNGPLEQSQRDHLRPRLTEPKRCGRRHAVVRVLRAQAGTFESGATVIGGRHTAAAFLAGGAIPVEARIARARGRIEGRVSAGWWPRAVAPVSAAASYRTCSSVHLRPRPRPYAGSRHCSAATRPAPRTEVRTRLVRRCPNGPIGCGALGALTVEVTGREMTQRRAGIEALRELRDAISFPDRERRCT